ncbi:MAG: FtsQ-type POTRA domain-containing protein [Rhodospirillales bacterium]|nr:FtsQ-type POTRA domain-containing protein [Rhodospirillales bacterium]
MRRVKKEGPAANPRAGRRTPGNRRGGAVRRWLASVPPRTAAVVALLVAAGGAGTWAWYSGAAVEAAHRTRAALLDATLRAGLRVEEIYVEGRHRTNGEHILAALQIERGDPILAIDLDDAKERIEHLAWVKSAAIERRLPDILHLRIVEREPIALWQHGGRFTLIDRGGHPIADGIEGFAHLPHVVGDDAPRHTADLLALLATEPELAQRVKAAVRVSGRRWNLSLDKLEGGIDVRMPEENVAAAWHRLAELDREHGLRERRITMIDLRLPDRLILRTSVTPPAAAKAKAGPTGGKDA